MKRWQIKQWEPGVYDLEMVARVNGVEFSRGNFKDIIGRLEISSRVPLNL